MQRLNEDDLKEIEEAMPEDVGYIITKKLEREEKEEDEEETR